MSGSSKLFLQIREKEFSTIHPKIREKFAINKVEPDDDELFKDDEQYSELLRANRKTSKALRDYKFDKRNP